jgi:hypothetical protein
MPDAVFYGTLLAEELPREVADYTTDAAVPEWCEEDMIPIYEAICRYEDADGFFYWEYSWYNIFPCSESGKLVLNYPRLDTFKLLLYFPETDRFLVSDAVYERYAFDSYFTVDAAELTERGGLTARRSYEFGWELVSLLCRIVGTIAVELGIAWLFHYRTKLALKRICLANVVTQTLLNLVLNIINYRSGYLAFVFFFILLEIAVFAIEGLLYRKTLAGVDESSYRKFHPWAYAFVANLISAAVGMLLAIWIPGIF